MVNVNVVIGLFKGYLGSILNGVYPFTIVCLQEHLIKLRYNHFSNLEQKWIYFICEN